MSEQAMTIAELRAAIDPLPGKMSAKGLRLPGVVLDLSANEPARVFAKYAGTPASNYADDYKWMDRQCSLREQIQELSDWIDALPTIEQARLNEFREMLAKTIELGKDAGIDDALVNPLAEAMKRLSENALTDQRQQATTLRAA